MINRILGFFVFMIILPVLASGSAAVPVSKARDAEIREAVEKYVLKKTANLGWDVRIKHISISTNLTLPEGPLEFEVIAPQQWEGWGAVNLSVLVRQGERVMRNTSMRVEVEALSDMVVTLRQLDHGTTINSSDIAVQKRDIASVGGKFSRNMDELIGKRTRTTIKANVPIRFDQVEKVPLITSGQMVNIVAENEMIKVTMSGKARSAGAEGDIIMVQNMNSLKDIPARVLNANTVQVNF